MKKVLKILMYLVLVYVVVVVTYGTIKKVKESIKEKEKLKKQSPYTDRISNKYPESTINIVEILEKIQKKVKREEKVDLEDGKYRINFYDDKDRLVYTILEENRVEKSVSSGVKWGKIVVYKAKFPKEEGTLYNEKGEIEAKILINQKYMSFYELNKSEDINNRVSFYHKRMLGEGRAVKYEYSSDNNYKTVEHEIDNQFNRNYKKIEKEYKNEKLVKEYILIDREGGIDDASSKILVEITKEYDKDEKLIKKFVLRKNKYNAMRSETNFDLIKGEIVTKYYDGEKDFATVTETLIGEDRAIVKRERVGDEFVIWDFQIKREKEIISEIYITYNNIITYKTNKIETNYGIDYNLGKTGINTNLYLWEGFSNNNFKFENSDKNNDYVIITGHFKEVYLINHENIQKIEFKEKDSSIDFLIAINEKTIEKWLRENTISNSKEFLKIKKIEKIREDFSNGY